jgi:hypothetical protein
MQAVAIQEDATRSMATDKNPGSVPPLTTWSWGYSHAPEPVETQTLGSVTSTWIKAL